MFRPVGIVVAVPAQTRRLLLRRSLLGLWLSLGRLGWLGGFLSGLLSNFFRGHFLGSFREGLRAPVRKSVSLLGTQLRETTRIRDTLNRVMNLP